MSKAVYNHATILDPRFKMDPWDGTAEEERLKADFTSAVMAYSIDYQVTQSEGKSQDANSIKGKIFKKRKIRTLEMEITEYLAEPMKEAEDDPLHFWRARQDQFPSLARFAAAVLAVPATSTPAERAFSKGGRITTDNRCSMTIKTLNSLACLHDWYGNEVDSLDA